MGTVYMAHAHSVYMCVQVKMDDIPLGTDWRQLCVVLFNKQLLWTGNSDAVVSAHGWWGAMNFDDACRCLLPAGATAASRASLLKTHRFIGRTLVSACPDCRAA